MEVLNAGFDSEFFSFLFDVASAGVVVGILLPFGFWCAGFIVEAFFKWVRSF